MPGYEQTYLWAPSATLNTYTVERGQSLVVSLPYTGNYTVTVTPLSRQEINGSYWPQNRFHYWLKDASWILSRTSNCQVVSGSGGIQPAAGGTVTVYCYDIARNYIQTYTESVTYSKTIYPKEIPGYKSASSSGQYISYSNGACNPGFVAFYYIKEAAYGSVTVYCYDANGQLIRQYTETVTESKMIYPQTISGYTSSSSGQFITFSGGACSPASVTFYYQNAQPGPAVLTVNCYDENGYLIRTYTEQLTAAKTVYPQAISGYDIASSGQYVTYNNGVCSPSVISFSYRKIQQYPAVLTVNCYDENDALIRTYTEQLTASRTVVPQPISGFDIISSGQYVTYNNGVCTPSVVTFSYRRIQQYPATLTVNCYDEKGALIRTYTVQLTSSGTVNPQAISGYDITSSGQYVTYNSSGTCSPSSISFNYKQQPKPAKVTIRCIDTNGTVLRTTTESITATKTFNPPSIAGYTALSGSQTVTYSNGTCSPAQVDFQYEIGSKVTPGSNPQMVYPTSWDTQFKPGTATHQNGTNARNFDKLWTMYDDSAGSSFFWVIYQVETVDNIPEFTAYFKDPVSISSVGIRNGNLLNANTYTKYARVKRFEIRIYDKDGKEYKKAITLPDTRTTDYQQFSLGATYVNVTRVEFWITSTADFYYGKDENMNIAHLADIAFFK